MFSMLNISGARMNKVKEVRKGKGMTQDELAMMIGANKGYVSDLENGNIRSPSLGRARLIAMALRVDLNKIFPEEYDK